MKNRHFIKSFEIKKFRGIDYGKIELENSPQWVFLTGENGFGKTSVLQGLAAGLYGIDSVGLATNEITKDLDFSIKINKGNIYKGYRGKRSFRDLICYGTSRLQKSDDEPKKSAVTYSLFNDDGYLLNFERLLKNLYSNRNEKGLEYLFDKVVDVFKSVISELEMIRIIVAKDGENKVEYKEKYTKDFYTYQQLATGWRSILNIIGDILRRSFKETEKNFDTNKIESIVLIDEFDAHLHPKWQRKLPSLLSNIFPNVQFIVSTHSPIPLLGAPENSAFLKVTRNMEKGIKIEDLNYIEVRNLTPNTILTSPIFDFEDLIAESHLENERLRTEETYKEVKINDETRTFLREMAKKLKKQL